MHYLDAGRVDQSGGMPGDQRDLGAALCGHPGQRVTLLARAAVADEADRVERLAGTARGDQHLDAGQVVRHRIVPFQQKLGECGDLLRLRQPARAAVRAGEPPECRFEHHSATAPQRGHVVDGRRVLPHLGVHRRCEQHGTSRREQRRGQQIVGPARNGASQQVGSGRRDDHQIGTLADGDVRHLRDVLEHPGLYRLAGQRLEGGGPDEAQCGCGRDDADLVARLGELTNDGGGLVCGDTPGDADDDPLAVGPLFARLALRADHSKPASIPLLAFGVLEQVAVNLPQGDRQRLLLDARLHQRTGVLEQALTELRVIAVDLPCALRGHDHEAVLAVHDFE